MMKYKGAVFFDYDGTLADDRCGIHLPGETTRKALAQLSKNGYMVVLNTGRSKASVLDMGIDFDGYVLTNGAYAEVDKTAIYKKVIKPDVLKNLLDTVDTLDVDYFCEALDGCYVNNISGKKFNEYMTKYEIPYDNFFQLDKNNLPETFKLQLIYDDEETFNKLKQILPSDFVLDSHRNGFSTDISQHNINKATGVEKICEHFNIAKENSYAFGDNTNDYDMIKCAGHGIIMGNHAKELEEVCEFITDNVENEGIYKALVKYGLIL